MPMVIGVFNSLLGAQRAVTDLLAAGHTRNAISVLARDDHAPGTTVPRRRTRTKDEAWHLCGAGPLYSAISRAAYDTIEISITRALLSTGLGPTAARIFAEAVASHAIVIAVHCEESLTRRARDILDLHTDRQVGENIDRIAAINALLAYDLTPSRSKVAH